MGEAVKTLMLGGVCMLVAAVLTLSVQDNAAPER
jgi:maltose/moltooligosaccharide transporter